MEVPTEDFPVRQKQLSVDIKASEIIDHNIYMCVCVGVCISLRSFVVKFRDDGIVQ